MGSDRPTRHPAGAAPGEAGAFFRIQTETGWGKTLAQFADWCSPQPGQPVLDVGCGPGLLPAIFQKQGCRAFGADREAATLARGRLHAALIQADASRLPFPANSFQTVTASNVLFLLPDPLPALLEMARVTAPAGQVCMLNPSERLTVAAANELANQRGLSGLGRASLIDWAARAEQNERWSERQMGDLYQAAGLTLISIELKVGPGFACFTRALKGNAQAWKPD